MMRWTLISLALVACSPRPRPAELVALEHTRTADYAQIIRVRHPDLAERSDARYRAALAAHAAGDDDGTMHHTRMAGILWRTATALSHAKDLDGAVRAADFRSRRGLEAVAAAQRRVESASRDIARLERLIAMRARLARAHRSARRARRAEEARGRVDAASRALEEAEALDAGHHAPGPLNKARQSLDNAFTAFNAGRYGEAKDAADVALTDAAAAAAAARPGYAAAASQRALDAELRDMLEAGARIGATDARIERRGLVLSVRRLFEAGEARVAAAAPISAISALAMAHPGFRIVVEGHTDNRGRAEGNQSLSEERAAAVGAALQAGGVPAGRITPVGRGDTEPVADNSTLQGQALNRRVDVIFVRPIVEAPAPAE